MLRTALYIRVSTEEQALHGYSLEAQREALTKYAKEHDLLIVDYYTDDGYTARKSYTKRKEFMRMMDDVKADKLDLILFIKLDRWFRSVKDYYEVQKILEAHRVDWKTVYENYDTLTASGRLHINIMLSVAQDESDRTSERIKFVFADKLRRKEIIAGTVPRGYKIENKLLVPGDGHDIDMIRDIFNHFLKSVSFYATARYVWDNWNWNPTPKTIKNILRNSVYIGNYHGIEGYNEPIIDRDIFKRANNILDGKKTIKSTPSNRIYIFSKIIKCAKCGRRMVGVYNPGPVGSGREYYYYRCEQFVHRRACTNSKYLNEKKPEKELLENIEMYINQCLTEYEVGTDTAMSTAKSEKAKIRKKIEKIKELFINDLITLEEYRRDYNNYMHYLEQIKEPVSLKVNVEELQNFLSKNVKDIYADLSRDQRRLLWRQIIKDIYVDENGKISQIFFA